MSLQLGYACDVQAAPPFDAATLINVLHFVPDDGGKGALLADIAGRIRRGGVFVFFDLHGGDTPEEHDRYLSAWRRYWRIRDLPPDEMREFNDQIRKGIHFSPRGAGHRAGARGGVRGARALLPEPPVRGVGVSAGVRVTPPAP